MKSYSFIEVQEPILISTHKNEDLRTIVVRPITICLQRSKRSMFIKAIVKPTVAAARPTMVNLNMLITSEDDVA